LPRGHAALAFVDGGVGFADRAAAVVAVGFTQDLWVLHISICITPETMSTFGYNTYRRWTQIEYQNKHYDVTKRRRNIGRPRKRWRDQLRLEG
jgi:hypothetical protein